MPTVLRRDGFRFVVYVPPREHNPAHVHAVNADGEARVLLGNERTPPRLWDVAGMKDADAAKAVRLVAQHQEQLIAAWRKYHGP